MKATKTRKTREVYIEPTIPMEALSWPTEPEPKPVDVKAELEGKPFGTLFVGWCINTYWQEHFSTTAQVSKGCSSGYSHSRSRTDKTESQNCGIFYATKKDAVLALRWALCRKFAKALHGAASINTDEP